MSLTLCLHSSKDLHLRAQQTHPRRKQTISGTPAVVVMKMAINLYDNLKKLGVIA